MLMISIYVNEKRTYQTINFQEAKKKEQEENEKVNNSSAENQDDIDISAYLRGS